MPPDAIYNQNYICIFPLQFNSRLININYFIRQIQLSFFFSMKIFLPFTSYFLARLLKRIINIFCHGNSYNSNLLIQLLFFCFVILLIFQMIIYLTLIFLLVVFFFLNPFRFLLFIK